LEQPDSLNYRNKNNYVNARLQPGAWSLEFGDFGFALVAERPLILARRFNAGNVSGVKFRRVSDA
jgi:hypothetical protein